MATITLDARPRDVIGKKVRHLRREGLTPIIVYGHREEAVPLQTSTRDLVKALHAAGGTQLISLKVEGEAAPRMTLVKSVDRHVTRLTPIHVDLFQVVMDELITQELPIHLVGESETIKHHQAILDQERMSVLVRALPGKSPTHLEADISKLTEVGSAIHASDLKLPDGVELMVEGDVIVARLLSSTMPVETDETAEVLERAEGEAGEGAAGAGDSGEGGGNE